MVKVLNIEGKRNVLDPISKKWSERVNITFLEEGRLGDAVKQITKSHFRESHDVLSAAIGVEVGYPNRYTPNHRVHTQSIPADKIGEFTIGKELPLYINRSLYSQPQGQQGGKKPRMINGQPAFIATYLSTRPEQDNDKRLSAEELVITPKTLLVATIKSLDKDSAGNRRGIYTVTGSTTELETYKEIQSKILNNPIQELPNDNGLPLLVISEGNEEGLILGDQFRIFKKSQFYNIDNDSQKLLIELQRKERNPETSITKQFDIEKKPSEPLQPPNQPIKDKTKIGTYFYSCICLIGFIVGVVLLSSQDSQNKGIGGVLVFIFMSAPLLFIGSISKRKDKDAKSK